MDNDIDTLESELRKAEEEIDGLIRAGRIPTPADYADVDRIKKELKAARRIKTMNARRTEPIKTSRFSILLPDEELNILTTKAKESGLGFSQYIRHLLKIAVEVEGKYPYKTKVEK